MLPIIIGVSQGNKLRPFLLLVYIYDLPHSCKSDIILYADAAALLWSDKTSIGLKNKSETNMQKIENWLVANKLKLNYTKTNYITFLNHTKANKHKYVYICVTNGTIVEQKSVNY